MTNPALPDEQSNISSSPKNPFPWSEFIFFGSLAVVAGNGLNAIFAIIIAYFSHDSVLGAVASNALSIGSLPILGRFFIKTLPLTFGMPLGLYIWALIMRARIIKPGGCLARFLIAVLFSGIFIGCMLLTGDTATKPIQPHGNIFAFWIVFFFIHYGVRDALLSLTTGIGTIGIVNKFLINRGVDLFKEP